MNEFTEKIRGIKLKTPHAETVLKTIWPPHAHGGGKKVAVEEIRERVRKEGAEVERGEILKILKLIEEAGLGKYVIGRRGYPTRIEWSEKVLSSETNDRNRADKTRAMIAERTIVHRFVVRPDFAVEIELPGDLTSGEAKRLADFIETLPFDRQGKE
jgi:hypothetical protein